MKSKHRRLILIFCMMMLSLTACNTNKSYTFQVTDKDKIKVTLDTTDGYSLSAKKDGTFTVQKEEEDILIGSFLTADMYNEFMTAVKSSENITIFEESSEDYQEFLFYQFNGEGVTETTYVFKVDGAEAGIIVAGTVSKDKIEEAFEWMEFKKVK